MDTRASIENFWNLGESEVDGVSDTAADVRENILPALVTGQCSYGLMLDIATFEQRGAFDRYAVIDQIDRFEGRRWSVGTTKPPTQFKHDPLKGLWHGHFYSARFLMKNLMTENSVKRFNEIFRPYIGQIMDREIIGTITHDLVIGSFERRAASNRLTGEWLIFDQHGGRNYYITIAFHNENPDRIIRRVRAYRTMDIEFKVAVKAQDSETSDV